MKSGVNFNQKISTNERILMYLKNACVALVSAKRYTPDSDCALVTNLDDKDIPSEIHEIFTREDIKIFHVPFDEFRFDSTTPWGLDFYKKCVLSHLLRETNYNTFMYLDSDVYVQMSLAPVLKEAQENILLYNINHGLNVPHYVQFLTEVEKFYPDKKFVTQYGGEFFAGNRENTEKFVREARKTYDYIQESGKKLNSSDEFLSSIAAYELKSLIRNASPYIFRFWTGRFRLVSTCYRFNAVSVLHMPSEKTSGIMKIYDKYIKKGTLPSHKQVWRICHLSGGRYSGLKLWHKIKLFVKESLFTGDSLI